MGKYMAMKQTVSQVGRMHLPSGKIMVECIKNCYKLVTKNFFWLFTLSFKIRIIERECGEMIYIQLDIPQSLCDINNEPKAEMKLIQEQMIVSKKNGIANALKEEKRLCKKFSLPVWMLKSSLAVR